MCVFRPMPLLAPLCYILVPAALHSLFFFPWFRKTDWTAYTAVAICAVCFVLFWSNAAIIQTYNRPEIKIVPIGIALFSLLMIVVSPFTKPNAVFGIRTKATEDQLIWKQTHEYLSILYSIVFMPQFILIFYFGMLPKLIVGLVLLLVPIHLAIGYADKRYKDMKRASEESVDCSEN